MRYFQCPICYSSLWTNDAYQDFTCKRSCMICGKFSYADRPEQKSLPDGNISFTIIKEAEWALIDNYLITVNFLNDSTLIETYDKNSYPTTKEIIRLHKVVQFDWYNKQSVIDKIKKYLVFL